VKRIARRTTGAGNPPSEGTAPVDGRGPSAPTVHDVARAAGVTIGTVSKALNGRGGLRAETRNSVREVAERLGYHPNAVARGLRAQRTQTIGFVDCDYSPLDVYVSPYSAGILTGVTAELAQSAYHVLIYPLLIGQDLSDLRGMLRGGRLDGVVVRLVEDSPASTALLEVISSAGIPCVCIERPAAPRFKFGSVAFDDAAGAFQATRYLADLGHRRIAHLHGDRRYATAQARNAGYLRALHASDLPADPDLVQGRSWSPFDVDAAVQRLLAIPDPPTAIFAANDNLAFRAIEILRASGRGVPDDVAVVGFDDIPLAREMVPPLTTVRIPLADLGRRAATRLLKSIHDAAPPTESETLPVELIIRGTA
jgi:LacI family transcriptional regulator